jgi:hypothetical protein
MGVVVEKKILGLGLVLVLVLSVVAATRKWNSRVLGGVRGRFRMWEMRGEEQSEKQTQCSLGKVAATLPCRFRCCRLVVDSGRVSGVGAPGKTCGRLFFGLNCKTRVGATESDWEGIESSPSLIRKTRAFCTDQQLDEIGVANYIFGGICSCS